ncbi:MAG: alpha/beta fold hydrolase [Verrucomicrobiota bacterium]
MPAKDANDAKKGEEQTNGGKRMDIGEYIWSFLTQTHPADRTAWMPSRILALIGTAVAAVLAVSVQAEPVQLTTADSWSLKATWVPAKEGKMTFILVHEAGKNKDSWSHLSPALAVAGFGYLAIDLRAHGESVRSPSGETVGWKELQVSKEKNDWIAMTEDLQAAERWLVGRNVPEASIGYIGADLGAALAVRRAATRVTTPLVVLISPRLASKDIPILNAVRAYKDRPILMVYSEADKRSARDVPVIYTFARLAAGEQRTACMSVASEGYGTGLFEAQPELVARVVNWIAKPVASAPPAVGQSPK